LLARETAITAWFAIPLFHPQDPPSPRLAPIPVLRRSVDWHLFLAAPIPGKTGLKTQSEGRPYGNHLEPLLGGNSDFLDPTATAPATDSTLVPSSFSATALNPIVPPVYDDPFFVINVNVEVIAQAFPDVK
jgi:hypothetical protein